MNSFSNFLCFELGNIIAKRSWKLQSFGAVLNYTGFSFFEGLLEYVSSPVHNFFLFSSFTN